jgi:hypothetical protein
MRAENLSLEETAKRVVADIRAQKKRIPGLGHPTHKGEDFRATKLRKIAAENDFLGDKIKMFEAIHTEFCTSTGRKGICINVDGMLGAIMSEMGFRPDARWRRSRSSRCSRRHGARHRGDRGRKPLRIVRDEENDYLGPASGRFRTRD